MKEKERKREVFIKGENIIMKLLGNKRINKEIKTLQLLQKNKNKKS